MPRFLVPVACLLLLGAPAFAADKREVADKNFVWTLPSDSWRFVEPDATNKEDGYALGVEHKEGRVKAWARVVPAQGLKAADLAEEMRTALAQDLTKQGRAQVGQGRLSGLAGATVAIAGERGGAAYLFLGFIVNHQETLHSLQIDIYHGAEKDLGTEIDALRRGYRLIKGAGPEEAPMDVSRVKDDDGAQVQGEDFPAGGPKREGRAAVFPSHNVRWTLPEGTPFRWNQVTKDETKVGFLIQAIARAERKSEGDGDPNQTTAVVELLAGPRRPGATPEALVNAANVQEDFIKQLFAGKVDGSKTKVDPSRKVGNHTGASFMLAGGEGKQIRYFIFVTVMLRDRQYEWRVVLNGGRDVLSTWGKHVSTLLDGVEFANTVDPVSGPLGAEGIGAMPSERGHSADKEVEVVIPGGSAKKPKGVASVPWEGGDGSQRLAWEARAADGMAYLFFDVRGWSLSDQAVSRRKLEEWVTEREGQWRTVAGSDAVTVTKGKEPWFEGSWGAAKGLAYRFTGTGAGGHAFVEQGWVVKAKGNVMFVRAQFGGADAEKVMDATWKAIKKGVKLN
jgi:hypothetical protein